MVDQLEAARKRFPGRLRVRTLEYPGLGHQIPDTMEQTSAPRWLEKFTRNRTPDLVIWQQRKNVESHADRKGKPGFTYPYVARSHYWIAVDELLGNFSRIEARCQGNEIRIRSKHYSTVTVRLNDRMVDLDQPVRIHFNDALVYEGTPARRLTTMIKTWEERQDPGRVFPTEVRVTRKGSQQPDDNGGKKHFFPPRAN